MVSVEISKRDEPVCDNVCMSTSFSTLSIPLFNSPLTATADICLMPLSTKTLAGSFRVKAFALVIVPPPLRVKLNAAIL